MTTSNTLTQEQPKPSTSAGPGVTSTTEDKALSLLGSGISAEQTALALGVSPSRISQLLANKEFNAQVTELRYQNLQSHNNRDSRYDSVEDRLLDKLEKSIPLMLRPMEILRAIQTINGAKRRGQSAPEQVSASATVVSLTLPTQIVNNFTTNVHNQVISAGEQDLITMQSGALLSKVEGSNTNNPTAEISHVPDTENNKSPAEGDTSNSSSSG